MTSAGGGGPYRESDGLACPAVRDAVCILREDAPGDKRIAAYVEMDNPGSGKLDLRPYLEQHLPAYAIPSAIVAVDAFPVTPNGKVDRAALVRV